MPKSLSSYATRRRWTVIEARAALAALAASGLSMAAFAAREGIDMERLRRWRRKLEKLPAAPAQKFVEIRSHEPESIEIVLRSGRVLRVTESVDPMALVRLVDALERSSC
jgi:transposase-like protein